MEKKSKKLNKKIETQTPLPATAIIEQKPGVPLANNPLVHIACIVFLILIVYSNTLNAPFQWDESTFIVNNPIVSDLHYFIIPSDAKGLELYGGLINRYVGYLTFALNYRIHGFSVTGYHIVNIAIHIANSLLVYFFVLLTLRTPFFSGTRLTSPDSPPLIAFFSAAIFAAHPLQTEAVTYVFQRFASLVTLFYLLSLVAYIKFRLFDERSLRAPDGGIPSFIAVRRILFYCISFLSAILAMKTKENAFTLPIMIVLYEFCFFPGTSPRLSVSRRLCYLAPILLTLFIIPLSLMLTGGHGLDPVAYGAKDFSQPDYLFTELRVIVTYLRLLFFPVNQNLDYDYLLFKSFFDLPVMLSFIFLTTLFGLGVWMITQGKAEVFRLMGFGILWFFITLSVESSIVPLYILIDEYRVYLPSTGIIICVVTALFSFSSRFVPPSPNPAASRPLMVLFALVILVLSITTYLRNELWADPIKLWEDIAAKSPGKARAHFGLGNCYKNLKMNDKALKQYLLTIKLKPDYVGAYNNLGLIYEALNMPDKAMEQYLIAINMSPGNMEAHINLGAICQEHGMPDRAIEQYLVVLKMSPYSVELRNNLGLAYKDLNMPDKAIEQYNIAIQLKPDYAEAHYNLGFVYFSRNMFDKAVEQFQILVKLKPYDAEAHNNLGNSYRALNLFDKAISELQLAGTLAPKDAKPHFNLGDLYYRLGQLENARREFMLGLNLKPDDQQARQLLKAISSH